MEYFIDFSEEFEEIIKKLKKKDKVLFEQIYKKLAEIVKHPEHYKPLKNVLSGLRRVHFRSFVLTFSIEGNIIRIISLKHHDKAY